MEVSFINLPLFTTSTNIRAAFKLSEDDDNAESDGDNLRKYKHTLVNYRDDSTRQLEPQQNWLARLLFVKPATSYLCFNLTKRRARQEVALLLKDWRQFGIKDVVVNKPRNLVFGKVAEINCKYPRCRI